MSEQLAALGIGLTEGFDESQIRLRPDLWVVGNVVARGNPLMEAILDRGERYVSGPQWLAEHVLTGRHVLAVAGTHGKTTVSTMLADPKRATQSRFLIGGVRSLPGPARHTGSPFFVIEVTSMTPPFDKAQIVHYAARPRF
jgi:UDP-N-acetylmuramate: L-alanyl-gamma-D-glutamyl-meso-diaminopimelate ligase